MDPNVRKSALLAALKVTQHAVPLGAVRRAVLRSTLALGLTGGFVGGCALQHGVPPTPGTDASAGDTGALTDTPDAPPLPDVPVSCDAHLASLEITAPEGGWGAQFTDEVMRSDPTTASCCHQMDMDVRAARERGEPGAWLHTPLAFACCDVVVFVAHLEPFSSLGCTPWGPPCPPEMPSLAV